LSDRGQRDEPDVLRRDHRAIGLRRRGDVRLRAREGFVLPRSREVRAKMNDSPLAGAAAPSGPRSVAATASSMIGILIIAHDSLGEGLAHAVTHVLGSRPPQFEVLSVAPTDDPLILLPAARDAVS